jgi:hypothetical protein
VHPPVGILFLSFLCTFARDTLFIRIKGKARGGSESGQIMHQFALGDDVLNRMPVHIGQAKRSSLVFETQPRVIETQ